MPSYSEAEWDAAHKAAKAAVQFIEDYYTAEEDPESRGVLTEGLMLWKPGQSSGWGDGERFQVAWEEGPPGWAINHSIKISKAMPEGWHVEPYASWLLTIYKD